MANLSKSQKLFIEKCGLTTGDVFDASGMKKAEYRSQMKALDLLVAYGVSPCKAGGHTMRTRHGHCLQCDTANLGFLKRYKEPGQVYLAWSVRAKWAKIGMAKHAAERIKTLNQWKYGGLDDWSLKLHFDCQKAGEVENVAQSLLAQHSKQGVSYCLGKTVRECRELFQCNLKDAAKALAMAASLDGGKLQSASSSGELNIISELGQSVAVDAKVHPASIAPPPQINETPLGELGIKSKPRENLIKRNGQLSKRVTTRKVASTKTLAEAISISVKRIDSIAAATMLEHPKMEPKHGSVTGGSQQAKFNAKNLQVQVEAVHPDPSSSATSKFKKQVDSSYRNLGVGMRESFRTPQQLQKDKTKLEKMVGIDTTYSNLGVGRRENIRRK